MQYKLDAQNRVLGRIASEAAIILRGKGDPSYVPYSVPSNTLVITNAARLRVSGNKREQKVYRHYSGYPGGLKEVTFADAFARDPKVVVRKAITGMLPKNKLQRRMLQNLTIFNGDAE